VLFLLGLILPTTLKAEEDILTIIVEEHRDIEIYVAPTIIINNSKYALDQSSFSYENYLSFISSYRANAKIKENGIKTPLSLSSANIMVYGKDTIGYIWDNCNYKRDYKNCSYNNGHYYIESVLTVTDHEISFVASMYDRDFQIVSRGISSSKVKSFYIPKIKQEASGSNMNCVNSICADQSEGSIEITYEKEVIPPSVYLNDLRQASVNLWSGVCFE